MDLEVIKALSPWILGAFSAGASLVAIAVKRSFASKAEVEALRQEQEIIKSEVRSLPDHDEFHQLQLSIEGMRGDLKAINAALKPLQYINDLRLQNDLQEKESR